MLISAYIPSCYPIASRFHATSTAASCDSVLRHSTRRSRRAESSATSPGTCFGDADDASSCLGLVHSIRNGYEVIKRDQKGWNHMALVMLPFPTPKKSKLVQKKTHPSSSHPPFGPADPLGSSVAPCSDSVASLCHPRIPGIPRRRRGIARRHGPGGARSRSRGNTACEDVCPRESSWEHRPQILW